MTNTPIAATEGGLLACPFCGGPYTFTKSDDRVHPYRITCDRCGAGTAYHGDYHAALKVWNTRTPAPSAGEDVVEALRNKLRMIICHASSGRATDVDASTNDICVRITEHVNHVYQAGKDAALSSMRPVQEEGRFWLVLQEPGFVPERKGSWPRQMLPQIMREFIQARPTAYIHVLTVDDAGTPWVDHGPEALSIADGRSMSVASKHNARVREAHAECHAALAVQEEGVGEDGWRPMSEAPKDWTRVLVWHEQFQRVEINAAGAAPSDPSFVTDFPPEATCWKHLPKPPLAHPDASPPSLGVEE